MSVQSRFDAFITARSPGIIHPSEVIDDIAVNEAFLISEDTAKELLEAKIAVGIVSKAANEHEVIEYSKV